MKYMNSHDILIVVYEHGAFLQTNIGIFAEYMNR